VQRVEVLAELRRERQPGALLPDLSRESRRYAKLALDALVKICKEGMERNRLTAARELLDRGYGRPVQAIDMITAGKRLCELTADELALVRLVQVKYRLRWRRRGIVLTFEE